MSVCFVIQLLHLQSVRNKIQLKPISLIVSTLDNMLSPGTTSESNGVKGTTYLINIERKLTRRVTQIQILNLVRIYMSMFVHLRH